jgi:hypothetical protein
VFFPRRSITGKLVRGRVWRRHDGRRWIYKRFVEYDNAEAWKPMSTVQGVLQQRGVERRKIGRTRINRSALLFFTGRTGVYSCCVRDVTNQGAGIRLEGLNVLPVDFDLSFDNFRTIRRCRLVWRDGDFVGVSLTWRIEARSFGRSDLPTLRKRPLTEAALLPGYAVFTHERVVSVDLPGKSWPATGEVFQNLGFILILR